MGKDNVVFVCAMCIVLCILPSVAMFYMTATRLPSNTYLISNLQAYIYAGLFMFMGIAPMALVIADYWKGRKGD